MESSRALQLVDAALAECAGRDIVSASEMTDILLDIRLSLEVVPVLA